MTAELPDGAALASVPLEVRFSYGTRSPALFQEITARVAAMCGGAPNVIDGVGHSLYLSPGPAADYIRAWSG
jgi:hypothetical protein